MKKRQIKSSKVPNSDLFHRCLYGVRAVQSQVSLLDRELPELRGSGGFKSKYTRDAAGDAKNDQL